MTHKGIIRAEITPSSLSTSKCSHRAGIEVDPRLSPPQSQHFVGGSCTVSYAKIRHILAIRALCTVCLYDSAFARRRNTQKKKSKHLGKYDTPKELGLKWQMDVKYVPKSCYAGKEQQQFYQYTMIEEASRKRYIYAYEENSSYSTIDFVKRAIVFFGYAPKTIQTDNGTEFTHFTKTKRIHPFDIFCKRYHIEHKLIRPRTPWHNGKVERSHRNDQERFYNHLSFYSFTALQEQMKRYLRRSNNIPMAVLGWSSPNQRHSELERLHS